MMIAVHPRSQCAIVGASLPMLCTQHVCIVRCVFSIKCIETHLHLARPLEVNNTSWCVCRWRRRRRHDSPLSNRTRAVGRGASPMTQLGMLSCRIGCRDGEIL